MTRLTAEQIKEMLDLSYVVETRLGPPARASGRYAWWSCPFHQEKTASFCVTDDTGTFKCFGGCHKFGDVFNFVMLYDKVEFRQAYDVLARLAGQVDLAAPRRREIRPVKHSRLPDQVWQDMARRIVDYAQRMLWNTAGDRTHAYLNKRGLNDDTLSAWNIGYLPQTRYLSPSLFGLERDKDVWLPAGIVLPGLVDGRLWYVKFRTDCGEPKYYNLPGGCAALIGSDRLAGRPALLLAEGEMDFYLAWQEAAHMVDVVTLGGTSTGALAGSVDRWLTYLLRYQRVLSAFDNDEGGREALGDFMQATQRAVACPPPHGKDVGAFYESGGDVAAWIRSVLFEMGLAVAPRPTYPGYPVTLVFQPGDGLYLPSDQWTRLDDGRLEATFETPDQLDATLQVTRALGLYPMLKHDEVNDDMPEQRPD